MTNLSILVMSQPKGQSVSRSYLHLRLTEGAWGRQWE